MKSMTIIWHEAGNPLYHDRFRELAKRFRLSVFGLKRFQARTFSSQADGFALRLCRAVFTGHWLTFLSPGILWQVWRSSDDLVYVHEEPHSLTAFLVAVLAGRKRLILESSAINLKGSFRGWNVFERFVYARYELIFPKNEEVRDVLVARGAPRSKLGKVIGNGVSLRSFGPVEQVVARSSLCDGYPELRRVFASPGLVVGYAGRIWRAKGLAMLPVLSKTLGVSVVACGPVKDQDLADELRAAGVVLLPEQRADELRKFYSAIDLFILPSLSTPNWREQFGRVCIEAIFCGTPAIGSAVGGIPMVVGASNTFEPGNDASAVFKVQELVSESARRSLHTWQFDWVSSQFSWEAIAAQVNQAVT
jgi:glycosyltransferase involved in cell wall biosynthesis